MKPDMRSPKRVDQSPARGNRLLKAAPSSEVGALVTNVLDSDRSPEVVAAVAQTELDTVSPKLTDHFNHIFVINCQHRPDRLQAFKDEITSKGLADLDKITVVRAVVGDFTSHPAGWGAGRGAWGCLQSHRRIFEDLLHMHDERGDLDWDSALILEDDVFFLENALADLNSFMQAIPTDWGQLYLGGQHRQRAEPTSHSGIVIGKSVNRTHAYAVSRQHVQKIYCHISYMPDYAGTNKHVDHQLELAHNRKDWPVYCPAKWICGQRAGSSNISGKTNTDLTWI
jgi:GR25 family glycosyltransferase involved in LPS biosynthesis